MEKPQALPLPRRPATNQRHALPPKRRGEIAELAFMQKAVSLGFGVAKPWGDSDRYDYILDAGRPVLARPGPLHRLREPSRLRRPHLRLRKAQNGRPHRRRD